MLPPLNERLEAPTSVTVPTAGGLVWRPATLNDLPAIHATVRLVDQADHPHFTTPFEEVQNEFGRSYVDLEHDSLIGVDADGAVIAYALVLDTPGRETIVRSMLFGGVRPDERGRGIGREVLAWQEQRARQQLASSDAPLPGWIMGFDADGAPGVRLFQRAGFGLARYFVELVRDLAEPIPASSAIDGIDVVPYSAELGDSCLAAQNAAFRDHWGSQPHTPEEWSSFVDGEIFRRDLSRLAITAEGAVVGFVLATVNDEDWPGQGFTSAYLEVVGVTREWRGRGLAAHLLNEVMRSSLHEGLERVVLDVDFENPTGARGLYERAGFVETHRSIAFTKEF